MVFRQGRDSRVWDIDGREFIDFTLSQGPLIFGHCFPSIIAAVKLALETGQVWNGLHCDEIELAERLTQIIPCAELLRFGSTGSEAVHAALRVARAFTGRSKIIKFEGHYHGWLDGVAGSINPPLDQAGPAESPACVPWSAGLATAALSDLVVLPWNDLAAVDRAIARHPGQIAAIITEPVMCNSGCVVPQPDYLAGLRERCDRHGIVLIFDEVITGFRLALGGAQQYFGVTPDLAVFGKAIAAGFPLSVVAGRRHVMQAMADGRAIHAGTLNAHVASIAAAYSAVILLSREHGAVFGRMHDYGQQLMAMLRQRFADAGLPVLATGPGAVFHVGMVKPGAEARPPQNYREVVQTYDMPRYARFVRHMANRGVRLIGRGIWYVSARHSDLDLRETGDAVTGALRDMATADEA